MNNCICREIRFKQEIFILLIFVVGISISVQSQNTDSIFRFDSNFNAYKESINDGFTHFRDQNDSVFVEFLKQTWKEYLLLTDTSRIRIKPQVQPRVEPALQKNINTKIDSADKFNESGKYEIPDEPLPEKNSSDARKNKTALEFYGEKGELPEISDLPITTPVDSLTFISFYRCYLKNPSLPEVAARLKMYAEKMRLNDYGYFLLVQKASRSLFREMNKQIMFTWISMLINGLDVKVGYAKNDIFLSIASNSPIYNTKHYTFGKMNYYIILFPEQSLTMATLKTYEHPYPGKVNPVALELKELPAFSDKIKLHLFTFNQDTIKVDINLNLINYLRDYPACPLSFYFNAPFSEKALKSLDRKLHPLLNKKSAIEKVNILLSFIQESFLYKTDQAQFGKEKYMYCDEAVYYPFTDCDDRSVLFARLVQHYTGLETIGLDYPNHVSVGVKFTDPIKGNSILYNNSRYYICDPTYIGARAGMAMDEMKTEKPLVISLKN